MNTNPYALAIHGGAGTIMRDLMTREQEANYVAALKVALESGETVLREGGSALDAVTFAVCALEDDPLFNAGRGAVFTSERTQEMDACVMDGRGRQAGAVAGIFGPKNPVRVARTVMERTSHVCLIGSQAEKFARNEGLDFAEPDYFFTQSRWDALEKTLALRAVGKESDDPARRHGTVGAVACDRNGDVAAATSTGGMTAKLPGRVGDTPMPGAGTFADNCTCAVSCTGHGEIFIRWTAGAEVSSRMRYLGETLDEAVRHVVMADLAQNDGSGGLIAVDSEGNLSLRFNSEGMYRAFVREGSQPNVAIYKE